MTLQPESKKQLSPEIESELKRAESLGLIKDPSMRPGILANLQLLAEHHDVIAKFGTQKSERE